MEYREYKLKEIMYNFKYGTMPKKEKIKSFEEGKYPIYTGYLISGYYDECNIENETLIVVARGVGGTGDVKLTTKKCFLTNLSIAMFNDEKIVSNKYLYYYFKIHNLRYLDSGSAQSQITINDLKNVKVPVPKRDIQDKIVKILSQLDIKIKLNNQINDNLQKFGLEMITQEMKKDATNNLRSIIRFIKGKKPLNISKNKKENYLPYLTIANLNNQENLYASIEKVLIAEKDLLMVMDGASSGDIYYSDYGIVGSTLAKIEILDDSYNQASIYFIIKYFSEYIKSKNTGSAIPHTDKEIVYKLIVPDIYNQKTYENILNTILENNKQNKKLEQLRDTLLPKLMNGEIDLDKIEI